MGLEFFRYHGRGLGKPGAISGQQRVRKRGNRYRPRSEQTPSRFVYLAKLVNMAQGKRKSEERLRDKLEYMVNDTDKAHFKIR